jgi:hypothetical protein
VIEFAVVELLLMISDCDVVGKSKGNCAGGVNVPIGLNGFAAPKLPWRLLLLFILKTATTTTTAASTIPPII